MKRHRFTNIRGNAVAAESDSGGPFKSALERDHYIVTLIDPRVKRIRLQRPKIEYVDETGAPHRYTADASIEFKAGIPRRGLVVECKYTKELKDDPALEKKFAAIKKAFAKVGYDFEVRTEKDIRTEDFPRRRFIFDYRNHAAHEKSAALLAYIRSRPGIRLGDAVTALACDWIVQLELVADVWRLVALHKVTVGFDTKFSLDTRLTASDLPTA